MDKTYLTEHHDFNGDNAMKHLRKTVRIVRVVLPPLPSPACTAVWRWTAALGGSPLRLLPGTPSLQMQNV
jgi:hypothetical protein